VPGIEANLAQVYTDAGVKFSGTNALQAAFLKKYPGYNTIGLRTFGGSSNYHALQAVMRKRVGKPLHFCQCYTSSEAMGTANTYSDFISPICSRCVNYRRLNFDRTHLMVINYDWRIPGLRDRNWLIKGVTNGWQVTGITQFISGSPTQPGVGIPNVNLNQRIAGSWTEGIGALSTAEIKRSSDPNNAFNWQGVRLPSVAEALKLQGQYPNGYLDTPGFNVSDLSLFKNSPLGGDSARSIQLRLEAFNVFNHPQFSGFNSGVNFNIATNFSDYLQKQNANASYVQNVRGSTLSGNPRLGNGLGEYNGLSGTVSGNRIIQLAVKIYF